MLRSILVGSALATSAILLAPVLGGSVDVSDVLSARTLTAGASAITIVEAESVIDGSAFLDPRQRATYSATSAGDDAAPAASPSASPSPTASATAEAAAAPAPSVSTGASASSSTTTAKPAPSPSASSGTSAASGGGTAPVQPKPSGPAPAPAAPAPAPTPTPTVTTPACAGMPGGSTAGAPGRTSKGGVAGTTSADLAQFAQRYNEIRVANCLPPIPMANIRYDSCMEDRLFWMAEDPSTDPMSAWGHIGSVRSDGVPSVGCDGNLAGGSNNSGATVAQKWWDSSGHRTSLYKPTYTGGNGGVCILFAMTHGGVPNEPYSFTRAAARWVTC